MIPIRLKISGFLSYLDPVEVDFSSFQLACISGANGAGKSSLLDAMTWVLFGQARRRDDALVNSRAKNAEVVFDFEYENNFYRVSRNKPRDKTTMLEFMIGGDDGNWKPLTEHSVKDTECRIQQTLHLDYETFTNASFFLQGKADQFSQQKPGDRKRILGGILGLDAWEDYREHATALRRKSETDLTVIDGWLAEIEMELGKEEERTAILKNLQKELDEAGFRRKEKEKSLENVRRLSASLDDQRRLVDSLAKQLDVSNKRLEEIRQKLQARLVERDQYKDQLAQAEEITKGYRRWQDLVLELRRWEELAASFHQVDVQRSSPLMFIESERARIEEEKRSLEDQLRQMEDLKKQLPVLESQQKSAISELEKTRQEIDLGAKSNEELNAVQDAGVGISAENSHLRQLMNELKERIERLNSVSVAECPLCGQSLSMAELENLINQLTGQGKELGDRYRTNLETLRQNEQHREDLMKRLSGLDKLRNQFAQQQRAVDQLEDRIKQIQNSLENWKNGGLMRLDEVKSCLQTENYALPARLELAKIDETLKSLGYDAAAHNTVRQDEMQCRKSEEQFRSLETAGAALVPLEREIKDLETGIQKDETEFRHNEEIYQQAAAKLSSDSAGLPDLDVLERELYGSQEEENRLRMQLGGAKQAVEVIKTQRQRKNDLGDKRLEITRRIGRLKMLERAFGKDGVPALLIEQALPEIEERANLILDQLTAGGMSVRFTTQRDYKDKSREDKKETLDILISDAAGIREYELFSGGEAFRVNFAIRLALSRYLAQRAGARLQTLVIDEGFGSQDADGRQRLLQAINLVQHDFKKVLIITHLEEMKEAFPARIEVEKFPNGSRVQVIT
jgi:DNA repair protein SbcC/Rad50